MSDTFLTPEVLASLLLGLSKEARTVLAIVRQSYPQWIERNELLQRTSVLTTNFGVIDELLAYGLVTKTNGEQQGEFLFRMAKELETKWDKS